MLIRYGQLSMRLCVGRRCETNFVPRNSCACVLHSFFRRRIVDLINKSVLSSYGTLVHAYKTTFSGASDSDGGHCFQFLGFDVLIDDNFRPILIEINRNCSLKCDTPLDTRIKVRAITQTLQLIDPRAAYRTKSKDAALKEREAMRSLSGPAYKEAQAAQQQAKYDARLQYEDSCVARYAKQEQGGFQRIYPAVATYAPTISVPSHAIGASSIPPPVLTATSPSAYRVDRQAVYDRLMQLALRSHSDTKQQKSSTPTTRQVVASRPAATKLRSKLASKPGPGVSTPAIPAPGAVEPTTNGV
jgi:hypothetical protein